MLRAGPVAEPAMTRVKRKFIKFNNNLAERNLPSVQEPKRKACVACVCHSRLTARTKYDVLSLFQSGRCPMSRYEYARSAREKSLLLIFPEGTFERLPFEIRLAAPWAGQGYGDINGLKPADRWHFHQLGYVMLRETSVIASAAPSEDTTAPCPDHATMQHAA
jgi:hypothetical protein